MDKLSPAFAPLYLYFRQVAIRVVGYVRKIGIMDFAELISVSKNRTFWLINKFSRITMKKKNNNNNNYAIGLMNKTLSLSYSNF